MTARGYAIVTPIRNEVDHLERFAESIVSQTVAPEVLLLVENGSTDGTVELALHLAERHSWIRVIYAGAEAGPERALPIVGAFTAGLAELAPLPHAVAKVDADVTLPASYFERLLDELDREAELGVVSGTCFELDDGTWRERFGTGTSVWGAARAYRGACLDQLLPLEPRTAWDWIDVAEAQLRGWSTRVVRDLPFYHHRREGEHAPSRWAQWSAQGRAAHYLGYRPSYLILRTLFRAFRDPAAVGLLSAYVGRAIRRSGRCEKHELVSYVREQQRLRNLRRRAGEALGKPLGSL